jgi:tetratricopeptide (TPR) repeat protein
MGLTAEQMERVIESELGTHLREQRLTTRQRSTEVQELRRELEWLDDRTGQAGKSLTEQRGVPELPAEENFDADVSQQFQMQRPGPQVGEEGPEQVAGFRLPGREFDIYEQMKWRLYGLEKGLVPSAKVKEPEEAGQAGETEEVKRAGGGAGGSTEERPRRTLDYEWRELSDAEMEARAREILGTHETFASFADDKFNRHLRAAEVYLKQGKYYRAADAYTLASIYKPNDPLAYAGKSHALFAAGEYMSSALFLSRALEIFPDYARFKIDVVAMVGDRDKLETRIVDVEQWWKTSSTPELQFLLAYVYYQMDRLDRANESIDNAYEQMPDAPAVITLKKVIETAGGQ